MDWNLGMTYGVYVYMIIHVYYTYKHTDVLVYEQWTLKIRDKKHTAAECIYTYTYIYILYIYIFTYNYSVYIYIYISV